MSRVRYFFLVPVVLLALISIHVVSPVASAQNIEPAVIAIVEIQSIMRDAAAS